jgi:hypothetical protein
MDIYPTPAELIRDVLLDQPIIGLRPHAAKRAERRFCYDFLAAMPSPRRRGPSKHIAKLLISMASHGDYWMPAGAGMAVRDATSVREAPAARS